jgi:subtilisin family serine protease
MRSEGSVKLRYRRKEVHLTPLEGVVAVRSSEPRTLGRAAVAPTLDGSLMQQMEKGPAAVEEAPETRRQWSAFEAAGWKLVAPRAGRVTEAARMAGRIEGNQVRQVLRDSRGNLMLDSGFAVVRLPPDMTLERARRELAAIDLRLERRVGVARGVYEVRLPENIPTLEKLVALQDSQVLSFAEPSLLQHLGTRYRPADPLYVSQWHLNNDGSSGGVAGADIKAEAAWDVTRGLTGKGERVRIAIIDNGMDLNHPDLAPALSAGGYFAEEGDGSARFVPRVGGAFFPGGNHGTSCMGMAGARENGRGVCGAAPQAALIPVACLVDQVGTQTTLALALVYAALPRVVFAGAEEPGADVITCSLGPNGADWDMTSVLDLAIGRAVAEGRGGLGTAIFWAVSNGDVDIALDEVSSDPRVVGVGRSNHMDTEDGSAHGEELDLLAPGVGVFSTTEGGGHGFCTGTSFAAPLAAGVGALALAHKPQLDPLELRARLQATCDKVGGVTYGVDGHHDRYGYGRINAARALA